jgi:hypothetical protein
VHRQWRKPRMSIATITAPVGTTNLQSINKMILAQR